MAAVIKIEVSTTGGLDAVKKDVQDLGNVAKESGGGFSALQEIGVGALRAIGEAVTGFALQGFSMLAGAVQDGIADAQQNAQIQAQTAAVIKSTGDAAGVSAQHVADYASSLSDAAGKSLFGDDQIQQSTNMLLTFTEIKGKVLDAATAITVDMAQALGGAPKDSAIQLGKALNDPIKGITALTRVGVTFTDEQKAQIQAMQEAGDMAGAQTVILNELNKEFGGSAAAAADATGGWSEFNGRMGEAKEALGAAVLPLLNSFAGVLNDAVLPAIETFAAALAPLIQYIQAVIEDGDTMNDLLTVLPESFQPIAQAIGDVIISVQQFIAAWPQMIAQIQPVIDFITANLTPILSGLAAMVLAVVIPAFVSWAIAAGSAALATIVAMAPIIAAVAAIGAAVGLLVAAWQNDWGGIQEKTAAVWAFIEPTFTAVVNWLQVMIPVAIQAATDFFNNILLPALNVVWTFIQANVIPIIMEVVNWLQVNIPVALQTAADFWNNVLLPALNAVWSFLNTYIIPIIRALINVELALLGAAVRLLAQIWMTVLLPALTAIWTYIQNTLGPVFGWLNTNILMPLFQTLQNIAFFVLGALKPYMEQVAQVISGAVSSAFSHLANIAGDVRGALKSIGDAVQGVISWLNDLIAKINSVSIPDWLEGHSPPPMADWFSYIGSAVAALNEQLPTLQANLTAQIGPQGQSITNTASTRSFTYAPNINTTGNVSAPMDLALASSLASV